MSLSYQDVLARIGAGSAHPGGFALTKRCLERLGLRARDRVLDAGCGTGRTACYIAARYGCRVTGLDIRPQMIQKARQRANLEGRAVHFVEGDLLSPPFPDESFDVIIAESVTVFVPAAEAVDRYRRLLVPGGRVLDVEMAARRPLPPEVAAEIEQLYEVAGLPTYAGWESLYREAGFRDVRLLVARRIDLDEALRGEWSNPDPWDLGSPSALRDPEVGRVLEANADLMARCAKYLGYVVVLARR
ncbi:MAG: class I SAM-dependent methyltransferase [Alicyclobacillaceae bacterium]|nr:class I SAM-dependent methyltransferase [Alicyclobacillaceae bacterium]